MQLKHFAVIGDPISHSLSPLLHQTGFDICFEQAPTSKITSKTNESSHYSYVAYHVKKEELASFMLMFRGQKANTFSALTNSALAPPIEQGFNRIPPYTAMSGLSVTLPHKKEIMQYADFVTLEASLAGAANTLYWEDGNLIADNTDIMGFLAPLKKILYMKQIKTALILGAGGAAAAVLEGLLTLAQKIGSLEKIYVCTRREEQGQDLIKHREDAQKKLQKIYISQDNTQNNAVKNTHSPSTTSQTKKEQPPFIEVLPFNEREIPVDLIVNTIPASLGGQSFSPRENFKNVKLAYDLLYAHTPFLQNAEKFSIPIINGEEMFLEQGAQQFYLWTQKRIPKAAFLAVQKKIKNNK